MILFVLENGFSGCWFYRNFMEIIEENNKVFWVMKGGIGYRYLVGF